MIGAIENKSSHSYIAKECMKVFGELCFQKSMNKESSHNFSLAYTFVRDQLINYSALAFNEMHTRINPKPFFDCADDFSHNLQVIFGNIFKEEHDHDNNVVEEVEIEDIKKEIIEVKDTKNKYDMESKNSPRKK